MMIEELNKRFEEAYNMKGRWLALYKELYWYVIPDRDAFNVRFNYDDRGKPTTQQIWDDTAVIGAYQRANDLHGLLMPKDRVWGKFTPDPNLISNQNIEQGKLLMDEINERVYFYLNRSNISRVVSASNLDLLGGTGVIWVESPSDTNPLYFRSIPAVATYLEYSTDDVVNNAWFSQKMSGYQVLKLFPDYSGKQLEALNSQPEKQYLVNYGQIEVKENLFYIYACLDIDRDYPLFEYEKPYKQLLIYRDRVRPGEVEGRGVGLDMLPTIIDLNKLKRDRQMSFDFKGNPPIFYDTMDYINPYAFRQWAGAFIPRAPGQRNPLEAFQMPEFPSVVQEIQDSRDQIRKAFMVDPLGEIDQPVKTATEISIRENRAQRSSATDISRLINELSMQVYETAAHILESRNLLVKDRKATGFQTHNLRFDFKSPLYDLQNQADINDFVTNMQIKQQFMGEAVALGTLELGEANDFLNSRTNLPSKIFRGKQQLSKLLSVMSQQAQQQSQPPQPTTTGSQVALPGRQQETI